MSRTSHAFETIRMDPDQFTQIVKEKEYKRAEELKRERIYRHKRFTCLCEHREMQHSIKTGLCRVKNCECERFVSIKEAEDVTQ